MVHSKESIDSLTITVKNVVRDVKIVPRVKLKYNNDSDTVEYDFKGYYIYNNGIVVLYGNDFAFAYNYDGDIKKEWMLLDEFARYIDEGDFKNSWYDAVEQSKELKGYYFIGYADYIDDVKVECVTNSSANEFGLTNEDVEEIEKNLVALGEIYSLVQDFNQNYNRYDDGDLLEKLNKL